MKALIITFSGTGNTGKAGKMIGEALVSKGYCVDYANVHLPEENVPQANQYDIVGFGYPIHAFNTPQIVLRYARLLPKAQGTTTFFFKTSGEPFAPNNASSFQLYNILTKKGYKVVSDTHLLMPYNIMFRYNDSLVKQMYAHTDAMAKLIVEKTVNGEQKKLKYNFFTILFALILRLQWFGAWINGPMIHTKKDKCIACGKCVRNCPTENIRIKDGKAKFGGKCTMCMGCVMGCPVDAIRPGFLNPWRVNGNYDFKGLLCDESIPDCYVNDATKGYFKLFRKYYNRTYAELAKYGIQVKDAKTLGEEMQSVREEKIITIEQATQEANQLNKT